MVPCLLSAALFSHYYIRLFDIVLIARKTSMLSLRVHRRFPNMKDFEFAHCFLPSSSTSRSKARLVDFVPSITRQRNAL